MILMPDLIIKKRDGSSLSREEIFWMVDGYTKDIIPDYQMSAMLMAIYLKGMNDREVADLTQAMTQSGDIIDLSRIDGIKVDKHSTGGVGDTTSLVLGPMVASCGVPFSKMSGRGLGHTGGTLDKLESIKGFDILMSPEKFIETINKIKIAIIGQSGELAPADKKLYALRDVTGTVDSIPLIAASIMSKKLAAGSDAIVLDVKRGIGAFMKKTEDAIELAAAMVAIGERANKKTIAVVSNMDQPLAHAIGNALEVKEAIETLKGQGSPLLRELCLILGGFMLYLGEKTKDPQEGREMLEESIKTGAALNCFKEMVKNQGGDPRVADNTALLPQAKKQVPVMSKSSGFVHSIDALGIGRAAMILGAGRATKEDIIDPAVGVVLKANIGDSIAKDQPLAILYVNDEKAQDSAEDLVRDSFLIKEGRGEPYKLVWAVTNAQGTTMK